jgi:tricorn protease-like protein
MYRVRPILATLLLVLMIAPASMADDPPPVSFLKDVAPILVQNCIACHNPKKSESKYTMTTFAQLAKGGVKGKGITLVAGDPDASLFVELCRPDGEPRMPYKQDPLPKGKLEILERWVKEGARYDGAAPAEDWPAALRKATPVIVPDAYPATVPITALAFSPDGAEVVASGYHEVTTWKTADGTPARRLRGMAERIHDIAYSPDGKWMATASGDPGQFGSVQLWIAEPDGGGKLARDLLETTDSVFAVAFSPDGTKLAAAGADRAVRVWEVATGKELALIEDHADWIFDLAWSPDGKRLATASRDKTSKVFDVEKKESIATFPGHAETIYCVAFTPDGKSVVTGGADNQVRVWNPDEDAKQVRVVGGFGGAIFRLIFAPDGKTLLACGADKTVRVFENFAPKHTLSGHNDWVYSIALSPDGKTIASGSWDGEVRLWNLADGKPVRTILAAPGYKPEGNAQAAAK